MIRAKGLVAIVATGMVTILAACGSAAAPSGATGAGASSSASAAASPAKTVEIAGAFSTGPYDYMKDNAMTGSDYDLCNAIAKQLNMTPHWSDVAFGTIITGVQTGRFDLGCAGINITSDRLQAVDMVPYRTTAWGFLQPKTATTALTTLDQLCGKQAAELLGSVFATAVTKQSAQCKASGKPEIDLKTFNTVADAITQVTNGRADVVILDGGVAQYYLSLSPNALKVTNSSLNPAPVGIAVAKGKKGLEQQIATALQQLSQNGTYAQILDKYGLKEQAITTFTPQP